MTYSVNGQVDTKSVVKLIKQTNKFVFLQQISTKRYKYTKYIKQQSLFVSSEPWCRFFGRKNTSGLWKTCRSNHHKFSFTETEIETETALSVQNRIKPKVQNRNASARHLLDGLVRRISLNSGEARETSYLYQRISVLVQQFNAVLLHDSLPAADSTDIRSYQLSHFLLNFFKHHRDYINRGKK